jgi:hypothetical protein
LRTDGGTMEERWNSICVGLLFPNSYSITSASGQPKDLNGHEETFLPPLLALPKKHEKTGPSR